MNSKKQIKQQLREAMPYGLVTTRRELRNLGFAVYQIDNLLKSGDVVAVAPGVYRSPETKVSWEGLVSSLQKLQFEVTVGGLTALSLAGYEHYLALADTKHVTVFFKQKLPSWLDSVTEQVHWQARSRAKIIDIKNEDVDSLYWNVSSPQHPEITLLSSRPELALLETLLGVPEMLSFEHVDLLLESLTTLSPKRIDTALRLCSSVKAKRLFLWFASRHGHGWANKLNASNYNLGAGKRMVAKPGKLDKTYLITVPAWMHEQSK